MGHVDEKPFAAWSDRDHPGASADEDAHWRLGITDGEPVCLGLPDVVMDSKYVRARSRSS
jgi:hypothetical protein